MPIKKPSSRSAWLLKMDADAFSMYIINRKMWLDYIYKEIQSQHGHIMLLANANVYKNASMEWV